MQVYQLHYVESSPFDLLVMVNLSHQMYVYNMISQNLLYHII